MQLHSKHADTIHLFHDSEAYFIQIACCIVLDVGSANAKQWVNLPIVSRSYCQNSFLKRVSPKQIFDSKNLFVSSQKFYHSF